MGCIFYSDLDKPALYDPVNLCQTSDSDCRPCKNVKQLESKILEAKRSLEDMLEQHRELRTQMNRAHDPMVHRFPPEIASHIFQLCMPAVPEGLYDVRAVFASKPVAMPLTLGAVCRHWRQTVWSTPHLWTIIKVPLNFPDLSINAKILREWLGRSGQLPLSIQISTIHSHLAIHAAPVNFSTLTKIINQHSYRWHILDLHIPSSLFSHLGGDQHSISLLRNLQIESLDRRTDGQFCMKNASPAVVSLSGVHFKSVEIGWNNVTEVDIDGIHVDDCFELLKRASLLRKLTLENISMSPEETFSLPTIFIIHHHLQVLDFESSNSFFDLFLRKVSLPGLNELVCNFLYEVLLPTASLISFFRRSSCSIRDLAIRATDFEGDDDIISLLEVIPSLRRIELTPVSWTNYSPDELFKRLAQTSIRNDSEGFLPELELLVYGSWKEISWQLIAEIFGPISQFHNPRRRPLHSVELNFDANHSEELRLGYIDKETIPSLLALVEAGFKLRIYYNPPPAFRPFDLLQESIKHHGTPSVHEHNSCSDLPLSSA